MILICQTEGSRLKQFSQKQSSHATHLNSQRGQGLIEYLILVSLIAIGSVAILRTVSQNIKYNYARVVEGLGGEMEGKKSAATASASQYDRKDLKNFFDGARKNDRQDD